MLEDPSLKPLTALLLGTRRSFYLHLSFEVAGSLRLANLPLLCATEQLSKSIS